MTAPKLAFGIEIELLFRPGEDMVQMMGSQWTKGIQGSSESRQAARNREILHAFLANAFTNAGVPTGVITAGYSMWSVVDERSLDEPPGYCKSVYSPS